MAFSEEVYAYSHMQRVYILRGVQRRCVWVVWRLGLAAWLACVAAELRRRPDTERICLAVGPTQFTLPHQTRQNSPVCIMSGVAV